MKYMLEKANNPNPYVAAQKTSSLRYLARNFFRNLFYYDYHRWVLWLPVFMAFGIGLYFTLNFEPVWYLGFCILGTLALFARVIRHSQILFMLVITLCFVALGFSAAQFRTARVATTSLQREIGPLNFSGRVMQMETMPTGSRVILENLQIDGPIKAFEVPERVRIRINTSKGESFRPGDWIKLYGVLRPPSSPASPHAFDFQRYAFFKGIGGVGFSMSIPQIIRQAKESNAAVSFNLLQSQIRQTVSNHIRNALPNETGAVATALITGEKKGISRNTMEAIRDAGLAHLLAISGLHIGLVAGLVFYIVRALLVLSPGVAVRHPIKTWAALAALIAAFGYTLLAGSTIPTLRAFTMMAFVLGAITMGRRGITLRLVAVAAIVILLFQPESLLGASFQLSFAAVTGLVATYEAISRRYSTAWRKRNIIIRMLVYLGGVGLSTFIAGLATAPFAAYHFHQLASYGVLANLFAVPATALWIMPSAVLGVVLMPLGLESIGLVPMGWGIDAVIAVAKGVAELPSSVQIIPSFETSSLVIMVLGALWLCLWQHKLRFMGAIAIAVGIMLASNSPQPVLLAHNNANLFAVQNKAALTVLGPGINANRFVREVWTERAGFKRHERTTDKSGEDIKCDHNGCVLKKDNLTIAIVWEEDALLEDCWAADIIISRVPVRRRCPNPQHIIDRFDLWKYGSHAIYLDEEGIRIVNTLDVRGNRPWTIKPQSRRKSLPSSNLES